MARETAMNYPKSEPRIKFIEEINAFDKWAEIHETSSTARLLWRFIFTLNNRVRWAEWVCVDNPRLMNGIWVKSLTTLVAARKELIEHGLIEFRKGKKGCPNRYKLVKLYEEKPKINAEPENRILARTFTPESLMADSKETPENQSSNRKTESKYISAPENYVQVVARVVAPENQREKQKVAMEHVTTSNNQVSGYNPALESLILRIVKETQGVFVKQITEELKYSMEKLILKSTSKIPIAESERELSELEIREIIEKVNKEIPSKRIIGLTSHDIKYIGIILSKFSKETFLKTIERAGESDFLLHEVRGFGFNWIIKDINNFIDIANGKYDNHTPYDKKQSCGGGASSPNEYRSSQKNKICNYTGRAWDYDELEKQAHKRLSVNSEENSGGQDEKPAKVFSHEPCEVSNVIEFVKKHSSEPPVFF